MAADYICAVLSRKHQLVALSIQAKILQISARNQMELTISVRSNHYPNSVTVFYVGELSKS